MFEKNFAPPPLKKAQKETQKRMALVKNFLPTIKPAITALIITGSLAYGKNFSITEKSDIDFLLTINKKTVDNLPKTNLFSSENLNKIIPAYKKGIIKQFSLSFEKNNVEMQCHFWDQVAFEKAITFQTSTTPRIKSQLGIPSTDYAYSFDGTENIADFFGRQREKFIISDFPSYRIIKNKTFLCRPITNILGCPDIIYGNRKLFLAINKSWENVIQHLINFNKKRPINLAKLNIINTLPGKNKVSSECQKQIMQRTIKELKKLKIPYII